jgi:hypothetical protein
LTTLSKITSAEISVANFTACWIAECASWVKSVGTNNLVFMFLIVNIW